MEEIELKLMEQFCDDIEEAAEIGYRFIHMEIQNILHLYDNDNEKLEIIESQRIKFRKKLKGSNYIKMCSSDEIIGALTNILRIIFKNEEMSHATTVEYSETLILGEHEYNPITEKLTVPYIRWYSGEEPDFNFADFHHFEPLKEYIQFSMLFIELRKLEAEIKMKKIVDPKIELPQIKNEVADALKPKSELQEEKKEELNPYQHIFKDSKAFELFEYLLDYFKGTKISQADCSFIFRQMKDHNFINKWVSDKEFIEFLSEKYEIDIDQLIAIEKCSGKLKKNIFLKAINAK